MDDRSDDELDAGAANRGAPARADRNGEVRGSGSGAGGGGAPEDMDPDSASGGGGDVEPRVTGKPNSGADASNHGSR